MQCVWSVSALNAAWPSSSAHEIYISRMKNPNLYTLHYILRPEKKVAMVARDAIKRPNNGYKQETGQILRWPQTPASITSLGRVVNWKAHCSEISQPRKHRRVWSTACLLPAWPPSPCNGGHPCFHRHHTALNQTWTGSQFCWLSTAEMCHRPSVEV